MEALYRQQDDIPSSSRGNGRFVEPGHTHEDEDDVDVADVCSTTSICFPCYTCSANTLPVGIFDDMQGTTPCAHSNTGPVQDFELDVQHILVNTNAYHDPRVLLTQYIKNSIGGYHGGLTLLCRLFAYVSSTHVNDVLNMSTVSISTQCSLKERIASVLRTICSIAINEYAAMEPTGYHQMYHTCITQHQTHTWLCAVVNHVNTMTQLDNQDITGLATQLVATRFLQWCIPDVRLKDCTLTCTIDMLREQPWGWGIRTGLSKDSAMDIATSVIRLRCKYIRHAQHLGDGVRRALERVVGKSDGDNVEDEVLPYLLGFFDDFSIQPWITNEQMNDVMSFKRTLASECLDWKPLVPKTNSNLEYNVMVLNMLRKHITMFDGTMRDPEMGGDIQQVTNTIMNIHASRRDVVEKLNAIDAAMREQASKRDTTYTNYVRRQRYKLANQPQLYLVDHPNETTASKLLGRALRQPTNVDNLCRYTFKATLLATYLMEPNLWDVRVKHDGYVIVKSGVDRQHTCSSTMTGWLYVAEKQAIKLITSVREFIMHLHAVCDCTIDVPRGENAYIEHITTTHRSAPALPAKYLDTPGAALKLNGLMGDSVVMVCEEDRPNNIACDLCDCIFHPAGIYATIPSVDQESDAIMHERREWGWLRASGIDKTQIGNIDAFTRIVRRIKEGNGTVPDRIAVKCPREHIRTYRFGTRLIDSRGLYAYVRPACNMEIRYVNVVMVYNDIYMAQAPEDRLLLPVCKLAPHEKQVIVYEIKATAEYIRIQVQALIADYAKDTLGYLVHIYELVKAPPLVLGLLLECVASVSCSSPSCTCPRVYTVMQVLSTFATLVSHPYIFTIFGVPVLKDVLWTECVCYAVACRFQLLTQLERQDIGGLYCSQIISSFYADTPFATMETLLNSQDQGNDPAVDTLLHTVTQACQGVYVQLLLQTAALLDTLTRTGVTTETLEQAEYNISQTIVAHRMFTSYAPQSIVRAVTSVYSKCIQDTSDSHIPYISRRFVSNMMEIQNINDNLHRDSVFKMYSRSKYRPTTYVNDSWFRRYLIDDFKNTANHSLVLIHYQNRITTPYEPGQLQDEQSTVNTRRVAKHTQRRRRLDQSIRERYTNLM